MWADYDAVLRQIRQKPEFTNFLLPPPLPELTSAVAKGSAVLVNVGTRRGDAVIITADHEPRHIPLPDLNQADLRDRLAALMSATHIRSTVDNEHVLPDVLAWLWDAVVAPIVAELPTAREGLPPVWWMPTGLLSLLPLHAAGHLGQPGALDTAISSYTPTLRALARARSRPPATNRRQLIVALEHTSSLPEADPLRGAATEARKLHARHPGAPLLLDTDATKAKVMAALRVTTWAHFACHASVDPVAASRSAIHLDDAPLPVPDISRLHLDQAELAYLAACSTAITGWRHADEALNLAAAFQLAGYRHVIASLWPLDDRVAVAAADTFYAQLAPNAAADTAARALHRVTHTLRTRYPDEPRLWAPLVHNGP